MDKQWVCIVRMNRKFGLMACEDGARWAIRAFESQAAGLAHFESAYERFHRMSYEGSMSACLNWLSFHPSIVHLSLREMEDLLEERKVMRARNVSGGVDYVPLIAENVEKIWEAGAKPELIR